jgi:cytosine/uracil/thiamine/allantoin permease
LAIVIIGIYHTSNPEILYISYLRLIIQTLLTPPSPPPQLKNKTLRKSNFNRWLLLYEIIVFFVFFQVSTLRFATRMMCVASEPTVNEVYDPAVSLILLIWAASQQNQHRAFATSMDPDQPAHLRSLIRIHACCYQFLYL